MIILNSCTIGPPCSWYKISRNLEKR